MTTPNAESHSAHAPDLVPTMEGMSLEGARWPVRERSARTCPTPHLTAYQYASLLACIDAAGGVATLDGISRALPRVAQPISAVLDLCDAGVLAADWEFAFSGDMSVWRTAC